MLCEVMHSTSLPKRAAVAVAVAEFLFAVMHGAAAWAELGHGHGPGQGSGSGTEPGLCRGERHMAIRKVIAAELRY